MDLLKIAARVVVRYASRSDVLTEVEGTFNNFGMYPPRMIQQGKDTYEGEIDTGWVLWVHEVSKGHLNVKLNGIPCKSVMDAAKAFKAKDSRYTGSPGGDGLQVTSIVWNKKSDPGFPEFKVEGTWQGQPFVYDIGLEFDGRDADWNHVSGFDLGELDGEADEAMYDALYQSQAYKDAWNAYDTAPPTP